uniref:Uncharacterized protein n=1 Tax=Arundo donax TaxID=35708 RepID=A0A0A9DBA2_ARUDO
MYIFQHFLFPSPSRFFSYKDKNQLDWYQTVNPSQKAIVNALLRPVIQAQGSKDAMIRQSHKKGPTVQLHMDSC